MSKRKPRIAIGSDHAGVQYKTLIANYLTEGGHAVHDFGTDEAAGSVDYPPIMAEVARSVASGENELGIVLGGSGNGEAIAANKIPGIRCALCWSEETARLAKEHNNANVIAIGQRTTPQDIVLKIVSAWLDAEFEGGRHERRIKQIAELEQSVVAGK